jgi:hypothetical protein
MSSAALQVLPAELVISILKELDDPFDVLNAARTCRHVLFCSDDNSVWAGFTRLFKYWDVDDLRTAANPRWKSEIERRYKQTPKIDALVNALIENPVSDTLPKFHSILTEFGTVEAKDRLLLHMTQTPDDAHDVLARRFWARKLFGAIQKRDGLAMLVRSLNEEQDPVDIFTAFDMLVIEDETADFDWVHTQLDQLTDKFVDDCGGWDTYQVTTLMDCLAVFLQDEGFRGPATFGAFEQLDTHVYQPDDCFISRNLFRRRRYTSPIILTVIFCAILNRLNVPASLTKYSRRYYASVKVRQNEMAPGQLDTVYYDIFNANHGPRSLADLKQELEDLALPVDQTATVFSARSILLDMQDQIISTNWEIRGTWFDRDSRLFGTQMTQIHMWTIMLLQRMDNDALSIYPYEYHETWTGLILHREVSKMRGWSEHDEGLDSLAAHIKEADQPQEYFPGKRSDLGAAAPKFRIGDCVRHVRNGKHGYIAAWTLYDIDRDSPHESNAYEERHDFQLRSLEGPMSSAKVYYLFV